MLGEDDASAIRVSLRQFTGPLDLLLYLVRRHELDILEIPVAKITDEYLIAVRAMSPMDLETAAEFLVLAATLVEIKTRMLLPAPPPGPEDEEEGEDPRIDLIRRLLEFRQVKAQAEVLIRLRRDQRRRAGLRIESELLEDPADVPLEEVGLFDLVAAYARLLQEIMMSLPVRLVYDDRPVGDVMDEVVRRLESEGTLSFFSLFREAGERSRGIGIFIALLELVRQRRVRIEQDSPFGDIRILSCGPAPETPESRPDFTGDIPR